jgi:hypothetical protein
MILRHKVQGLGWRDMKAECGIRKKGVWKAERFECGTRQAAGGERCEKRVGQRT